MSTENVPAIRQENALAETQLFELAQREAKLLATSTLIPDAYRGNMGNCFIAVHTARKLDIDPLMFMQRSYPVKGRIGLEGQLVIALVNKRGPYVENLSWQLKGEGDKLSCTCNGKRESGEIDTMTLSMADVKKHGWDTNPKWKQMPEQMLRYRTASWLARAYCPEVTMGFYEVDEVKEMQGVSVEKGESAKLNEALNLTAKITVSDEVEVPPKGEADQVEL